MGGSAGQLNSALCFLKAEADMLHPPFERQTKSGGSTVEGRAKSIVDSMHRVSAAPWRIMLFRILAALVGLAYLPGALLLILPWAPASFTARMPDLSPLIWAWARVAQPDMQRWAFALSACVDEVIAVVLLYLAWRPLGKAILVQFLSIAFVVAISVNVPFVGPGIIVAYSALLVVVIAYPETRLLLTPIWKGRIGWVQLGLCAVSAGFFIPQVRSALQSQIEGAGALARSFAWASIAEHLVNLWLIAFFASFRRPEGRILDLLIGACFLYLGAAAVGLSGNPGSWGAMGGILSLLGGVTYVGLFVYGRKSKSPTGTRGIRQET